MSQPDASLLSDHKSGSSHQPLPRQVLPRYRREQGTPPPFALQERDVALLDDLCRFRLLTTSQIEILRRGDMDPALRFVSRLTLTRRLKLLFHHGYVQRMARPLAAGSLEPVYLLDREGAKALRKRQGDEGGKAVTPRMSSPRAPSQRPKAAALEHLLAINQFRLSLEVACRASEYQRKEGNEDEGVQLLNWKGSGEVRFTVARAERGEKTRTVSLIPDGFFTLRSEGQRLFFFLETDLGTEPGRTLAEKCQAYYLYWQSGGFARDFSVPQGVGFRVLFIAPTSRREATVMQAIRQMPAGRGMFWTALQEQVTPQHLLAPVFASGVGGPRASLT